MTTDVRPQASAAFILTHLAACALAWGSSFLFIKLIGGSLPPIVLAMLRGAIAAVGVGAALVVMRQWPLPSRDELIPWAIIGLINGTIPNTLVTYAMARMDSGPAVLIQSVGPLLTAVLAHLLFADEKLGGKALAGIAVGFFGVALLIGPDAASGSATFFGTLAMLGVATCYTIGNLYTRLVRHHDPIRLAMGQQLFSAIFASTIALPVYGFAAMAPAGDHVLSLLMLGIVCTSFPIAMFMRLIVRAGPTRAALTGYVVPAVAVAIGAIFLHERLTLWQAAGGITVMIGVWLVAISKKAVR